MNFVCPSCSITLQAEPDMSGKTVKCPGCSTKIQIPEIEAPPEPDEAAEEHSAGDEMADDHFDSLPELNVSAVEHGPHPSTFNVWMAMGIAAAATLFWYIGLIAVGEGNRMYELFLDRGWVQYVSTFMMFLCLGILILKSINIRKQRRAMLLEALPKTIDEEIMPSNLKEFHDNVLNFPKALRNTYIVNRIRKALEFFYVRQNNPEVAQMIGSQSDVDANKVVGSYSMVKVLLWAIPIMGFIGTVVGIGKAIGGFDAVLDAGKGDAAAEESVEEKKEEGSPVIPADGDEKEKEAEIAKTDEKPAAEGGTEGLTKALKPVLSDMGSAFDTTLLALVFSILLSFPAASLQRQEDDLVTDVDEYCIDNLLKRLNDGGAASGMTSDAGTLKAIGDVIAANQKDIVGKFSQTQKTMSENLSNQTKQHEKVAAVVEKQLEAIGERAEKYETRLDEDFFKSLEKIRTESVTAITNQVNGLSEGINNLNAVLKDLNGKTVQVKKKGWFG